MNTKAFTLPAGTVCKRGGIPFELAAGTVIRCHPETWPLIRDGFKPEVGNQRLSLSQDEQVPVKPCHAAGLPVMSTTNNSSLKSSRGDNQSRICAAVACVSTIQVESKQCQ